MKPRRSQSHRNGFRPRLLRRETNEDVVVDLDNVRVKYREGDLLCHIKPRGRALSEGFI